MSVPALDPRFVLAPSLQEFFIDLTNNLPMSGGYVYFYQNTNRNNLKAVYELQQALPTDPITYVPLPNPVILSGAGTIQDANGNDVLPYYFPYEGTPEDSSGAIDLYYIVVTNAAGNPEFTREAFPNITEGSASEFLIEENFVANGQFLFHNNQNGNSNVITTFNYGGGVTTTVFPVAQGGWTFERSDTSTATDTITFDHNNTFTTVPSENPRYAIRINRTIGSNDAIIDLRLRYMDVNKFFSPTQNYFYIFNAVSNNGSNIPNVNIELIQYFGTGGSPSATVTTAQGSPIMITPTNTQFVIPIVFPSTSGMTIGTNDDDFIQIAIRFAPSTTFNCSITDVMLIQNAGPLPEGPLDFAAATNGDFFLTAMSNIAPVTHGQEISSSYTEYYPSDGSDLYLPVIKTLEGWTVDYSQIGQIVGALYATNTSFPLLLCNGAAYQGSSYSSLGIPYSRLLNVFLANSPVANIPLFGTGLLYNTAYNEVGNTAVVRITTNEAGAVTPLGTGTSTFATLTNYVGSAGFAYTAYSNVANTILAVGSFATPHSGNTANAGTSGFTVNSISANAGALFLPNYQFTLLAVAASALEVGSGMSAKYFEFSNSTTDYYMWFQVTGEVDPAVGGRTGIKVALDTTSTAQDVANIIREAINGLTVSQITCLAGSAVTAGSYFTFSNNESSPNFVAWYTVNGAGLAPLIAGATLIQVNILSTNTAAQVAAATQLAINSYQFAVPNFQGIFFRGLDPSAIYDADVAQRFSSISGLSGAYLGTFEPQQYLTHNHPASQNTAYLASSSSTGAHSFYAYGDGATNIQTVPNSVAAEGGNETRPVNAALNWFIKY
jgi:hypothetical protein